jgi:hypothetical protein
MEENNFEIDKLEEKIDKENNNLKLNINNFYKQLTIKQKEAKFIKKISNGCFVISIIDLSLFIWLLSLGSVDIFVSIAYIIVVGLGLKLAKDYKNTLKNLTIEKRKFNDYLDEKEEQIEDYEELLEYRKTLKECLETKYVGQYDKQVVSEYINYSLNNDETSKVYKKVKK